MEQLGVEREDEYLARLRGAATSIVEAELRNLLNLVTVTETCFFRDATQFRLLRDHIIPTLLAERSARGDRTHIRIWSAGCSSGEEAYSSALTLEEMRIRQTHADWTIDIVGTDVNSRVLEKARQAVYTPRSVRNVEGRLLEQYFSRQGRHFALNDEIKRRVKFEFGNLTQTAMPSTGPQDIIFCKNVAIYFRPEVTRKLLKGLHDTLAPDGHLLLGHAESLWPMTDDFSLVEHAGAFCYRKRAHVTRESRRVLPEVPRSAARRIQGRRATSVRAAGRPKIAAKRVAEVDAAARYDSCLAAFRAGDWDGTEAALATLIEACPTFVPALLLRGGLYVHRGRFDEARRQAELVLELSDLEPRAHLLIGMIAARQQRPDEAVQALRRALYLDDSLALAHFWLGNLYRDRGDMVRACHEYENVVRDWELHTLELTEEFASDLTAEQLVGFCSEYLKLASSR